MRSIGLYLHIPFCKQKCNYCDFYSLGCQQNGIPSYIDALCEHIKRERDIYKDCVFDTIFIGGGTPSLMESNSFERLMHTVKSCLNISKSAEISIEANPGTLTRKKLRSYLENGVNRISIGLQSTNNEELKLLGRIHTCNDFLNSYHLARECGFTNINVDIMYGLPNQRMDSFMKTVEDVCVLSPEHISAYCLKIEENTPFYKVQSSLELPNDDEEYDMYMALCHKLSTHGYQQYEISNFSKKRFRCVHNLKYWESKEYVGFGPSAHSFFDGKRYFYENSIEKYKNSLESIDKCPAKLLEERTDIDKNGTDEYIMLKLRLSDGVSEEEFRKLFKKELTEVYPKILKYADDGYMVKRDGSFGFTPRGFFVSNFILSDILCFGR